MSRIVVRLKSNVSLVGTRNEDFKEEKDGFWMDINPKTNLKYYVPYDEIDEIIEKGERKKI